MGQVEPIVVNRGTHTGTPNEIVAGNNRAQVMIALGWTEVAISWVDVADRTTLNKLAVALNKASEKGSWDERALADIMAGIAAESDLIGTGFDDDSYADLMQASDYFGDQAGGAFAAILDEPEPELPPDYPPPPASPSPSAPAPAPAPAGQPAAPAPAAPAGQPVPPAPAPTPPAPAPVPQNAAHGYVTVSWVVLPEGREIVREALRLIQANLGVLTSAEALVALADHYVKEQV